MSACLSAEIVERYVAGNCAAAERQEVETHIAECDACRSKIESIRVNGTNQEQSATATAGTEDTSREIRSNQAESPTRSMPGLADVLPEVHISDKSAGPTFENYQILEELPRGGQAVVYKAIHIPTKTKAAIKVLLPSLLPSARARYYFEREAELISRLDHPNIVKIRDSGIIQGQYYFIMEYIEGESLDRYVRAKNLSFRERVLLFKKVCAAVTHAHQQGIIHRDLKFGNIIVDERGEPHILDFGLAKAIGLSEKADKDAMVTVTGQWAGSLSNMSPEQAAGQPDLIDARTDVYSLGVIVYHMLTGTYPYDVTGSTLEVLQNVQKAEPIRPRQIIRKFDSDVEAILLTALAKDKELRYQSAAELQSDIENWLEGRPIRVRSISTVYLLRKIISRHRYASTVAGLLIVIILSFSYVSFDLYLKANKAQRESEFAAEQFSEESAGILAMAQQAAFNLFIQEWHAGRNKKAKWIARHFTNGSKEKKAAIFLLDPNLLVEKEADFRQIFSDEYAWFVDFIVGEHHLKDGKREKALEAFQRSYQAIQQFSRRDHSSIDEGLAKHVKDRLHELTAADKPVEKMPAIEDGD